VCVLKKACCITVQFQFIWYGSVTHDMFDGFSILVGTCRHCDTEIYLKNFQTDFVDSCVILACIL
jgi:hypothetical protein